MFRFQGCEEGEECLVEYFQSSGLRVGRGVMGGVSSDFVAARGGEAASVGLSIFRFRGCKGAWGVVGGGVSG